MTGFSASVPVMGTGATVRLSGESAPAGALERIRSRCEALENRFSLYRPESELSLVAAGRLELPDSSEELRSAYTDAIRWRNDTSGHFTPHRPDGVVDLNGIVKAYALREAADELVACGAESWLVEIGGDVVSDAIGRAGWTAGIADPAEPARLITSVQLGGSWTAVATSGTSERGEHVWRSSQLGDLVQATVLGRDIVAVDVLATAVLAGGLAALDLVTSRWPVDVLTVDRAGDLRATPRLREHLRRAVAGAQPELG